MIQTTDIIKDIEQRFKLIYIDTRMILANTSMLIKEYKYALNVSL